MAGCSSRCGHYLFVSDFVQERQRWEQWRDDVANGYAVEEAEFARDNPGPTLKQWMVARAVSRDTAADGTATAGTPAGVDQAALQGMPGADGDAV